MFFFMVLRFELDLHGFTFEAAYIISAFALLRRAVAPVPGALPRRWEVLWGCGLK